MASENLPSKMPVQLRTEPKYPWSLGGGWEQSWLWEAPFQTSRNGDYCLHNSTIDPACMHAAQIFRSSAMFQILSKAADSSRRKDHLKTAIYDFLQISCPFPSLEVAHYWFMDEANVFCSPSAFKNFVICQHAKINRVHIKTDRSESPWPKFLQFPR